MAPPNATWNGSDSQGNPLTWGMPGLTWNGQIPPPPNTTNRMPHLRVSLAFTRAADHTVEETASDVSANLFGKAAFPSPPVTKAALDAANTAFGTAITAQATGGKAATADKNNKRDLLTNLLRLLAGYVQIRHGDDLAVLLSSGFEAVVTSHPPAVLVAPTIIDIINGDSAQLIIRVIPIKGVRMFKVRYAAAGAGGAPGPWQDGGLFTDSRRMAVDGLTPGTAYTFQVQIVGSGNLYSPWSDPVSHMSL